MKIGHIDNATAVGRTDGDRQTGKGRQAGAGEQEASAQVELSSTATSLSGGADFDAAKVERISQAIRDGKFQVNPEAIADKLIANAQEVLGRAAH